MAHNPASKALSDITVIDLTRARVRSMTVISDRALEAGLCAILRSPSGADYR